MYCDYTVTLGVALRLVLPHLRTDLRLATGGVSATLMAAYFNSPGRLKRALASSVDLLCLTAALVANTGGALASLLQLLVSSAIETVDRIADTPWVLNRLVIPYNPMTHADMCLWEGGELLQRVLSMISVHDWSCPDSYAGTLLLVVSGYGHVVWPATLICCVFALAVKDATWTKRAILVTTAASIAAVACNIRADHTAAHLGDANAPQNARELEIFGTLGYGRPTRPPQQPAHAAPPMAPARHIANFLLLTIPPRVPALRNRPWLATLYALMCCCLTIATTMCTELRPLQPYTGALANIPSAVDLLACSGLIGRLWERLSGRRAPTVTLDSMQSNDGEEEECTGLPAEAADAHTPMQQECIGLPAEAADAHTPMQQAKPADDPAAEQLVASTEPHSMQPRGTLANIPADAAGLPVGSGLLGRPGEGFSGRYARHRCDEQTGGDGPREANTM